MGISTDQGVNVNLSQNILENASAIKDLTRKEAVAVKPEDVASLVAEKDGEKDLGNSLISNVLKKAADADIEKLNRNLQKNVSDSFNRELESLYQRENLGKDEAVVSRVENPLQNNKSLKFLKNQVLAGSRFFSEASETQKGLLKNYSSAYQAAAAQDNNLNPALRDRNQRILKDAERAMQQEGMDDDGLETLQKDLQAISTFAGAEKQNKLNKMIGNGRKYFSASVSRQQKELLGEFLDVYPQVLLHDEKNAQQKEIREALRNKLEQLEQEMEQSGLSKDDIARAKASMNSEAGTLEADKANRGKKKNAFRGNRFFQKTLSDKQQQLVKEYTLCYPKMLQAQSHASSSTQFQQLTRRVIQLEKQLQREGMSSQQLADLKMQMRCAVRAELLKTVKDAYINRVLSEPASNSRASIGDKLAYSVAQRSEQFLSSYAFNQHKLGGKDFGGYRGGWQGSLEHVVHSGGQELSSFAIEEISLALIKSKIDPEKAQEETQSFEKLLYIIYKNGGDISEIQGKMKDLLDDLGFVDFKIEDYGDTQHGEGDQRQRQPDYGEYTYSEDDEKEILINRYKALLMKRAVYPDSKTYLETAFQLRKARNGLMQLGIFTPEFEEALDEEAKRMAVQKLLEMLKEGLMERATYYECKGPAYKLNEKKIKGTLKNLHKLGCPLSEDEFRHLRDQANKRMFDITDRELQMVNLAYKNRPHPFYVKKRQLIIKLLERLKAESQITAQISYDTDMLGAMGTGGKTADFSQFVWEDVQAKLEEAKFLFEHSDIYAGVVHPLVKWVSGIDTLNAQQLQDDFLEVKRCLDTMEKDLEANLREELRNWLIHLRTMLVFIERSDRSSRKQALRKLIGFIGALLNGAG